MQNKFQVAFNRLLEMPQQGYLKRKGYLKFQVAFYLAI